MTTWTVWEYKQIWHPKRRIWSRRDRIIATGVSQAKADVLIAQGTDRVAVPEQK